MKFADYFREINIGSGSVSMWKNNDGSYFVIEIVRFAEHDKESARQYAALLSGDENYKVDENLHYTLH